MDLQDVIYTGNKVDWSEVRKLFPVTSWDKLHFNSGSAGVMPIPVQEYLFGLIKKMNSQAPYVAWSEWQSIKSSSLQRMASILDVQAEELMVVRNTTEALNMIMRGLSTRDLEASLVT